MQIRDRITDFKRVPASQLIPNPLNWRRHPAAQQDARTGVLDEIGFADAVIARETPAGLELVDGHLRADVMGDEEVPVLVVDLNADEALQLLLTLDPLAMMAEKDDDADDESEEDEEADQAYARIPISHEVTLDHGAKVGV